VASRRKGFERRHRDTQPVGERQVGEQRVEMSLAIGAVQANGRCPAADSRPSPQPDEMPLVRQLGCSRRLGLLAVPDFGLRRSCWNVELELDEELKLGVGHVGTSVPACSATM
jgi:hypothetical protein